MTVTFDVFQVVLSTSFTNILPLFIDWKPSTVYFLSGYGPRTFCGFKRCVQLIIMGGDHQDRKSWTGRNYQSWKYNIKLVLMERGFVGIHSARTGKHLQKPVHRSASKNAFRLWSDKAYSLIALNVEKDLQVQNLFGVGAAVSLGKFCRKQFRVLFSVTQIVRVNRKFLCSFYPQVYEYIAFIHWLKAEYSVCLSITKTFQTTRLGTIKA